MSHDLALQLDRLRQAEDTLLPAVINSIPDCIYFKDLHGCYLLDNAADRAVLGIENAADLVGKTVYDFFPREIADRFAKEDQAVIDTGKALIDSEEPYCTREGELRWFSTTKVPLHNSDGEILGVLGISRDITERKRSQDVLLEIQKLLHRLSGPLWEKELGPVVATSCRTLFSNDAFSLQVFKEDASCQTLYAEDTFEEGHAPVEVSVPTGQPCALRTEILHTGIAKLINTPQDPALSMLQRWGAPRVSRSIMYVPIRWERQVVGILSAQSYITGRFSEKELALLQSVADFCGGVLERLKMRERLKDSEEQARQSQKLEAIGGLAGGIAHDFNNLLTVIRGRSELMLGKMDAAHPFHNGVQEIHRTSERAAELTQKLLAFSRRQMFQLKVLDMNAVTADMEKLLRRLISEDVELSVVGGPNLAGVKADPAQIEQVILNLAINARDAMPNGGRLTIETANVELDQKYANIHAQAQPGEYVMLAVSDTGTGMSKETQSRIFEPFFTTKPPGKGTGLGLSTVYGIVKQSGGHIWVYSELNKGTTFKIYLPRVAEPFDPTRTMTLKARANGNETVLLVEDEENVRGLIAEALADSGYSLVVAKSPQDAISICETYKNRIDLMLTDVVMPGLNGRELAERVKLLRPDMRVLYMSGYSDNAVVRNGILARNMDFLQKPFTLETLNRKVRRVLEK